MNAPRRHPLAKADIEREARWYETQQPGLGEDFVEEVKRAIGLIAENPLRCSIRFGNWRRAKPAALPSRCVLPGNWRPAGGLCGARRKT